MRIGFGTPASGAGTEERAWWKEAAALLVAIVLFTSVATVAIWVTQRGRSESSVAPASYSLVSVRTACDRWAGDAGSPPAGTDRRLIGDSWCQTMVAWMSRHGAGPAMMGRLPWTIGGVGSACRAWVANAPASGNDANWCDDMARWMRDHHLPGLRGGMSAMMGARD